MSIKKSLLAMAVTALALMGFASSTMAATDGVIRDVITSALIEGGTQLHAVGFAKFSASVGSYECHVTATIEATGVFEGNTGVVTNAPSGFTVPSLAKCTGTGFLSGCKLSSEKTQNLPYNITVTPTDLDVTGNIVIVNKYTSCLISEQTLGFSEITVKPLRTGSRTVTGTEGHLGTTAAAGEAIAGFELSGSGLVSPGSIIVNVSGELELTSFERCTYELSAF